MQKDKYVLLSKYFLSNVKLFYLSNNSWQSYCYVYSFWKVIFKLKNLGLLHFLHLKLYPQYKCYTYIYTHTHIDPHILKYVSFNV